MKQVIVSKKFDRELRKDLPELFDSSTNFSLKRMPSKKNIVFDIRFKKKPKEYPEQVILKIFQTENYQKELDTLKKLKVQKLKVPEILFEGDTYLLMEKIQGDNLCDFINNKLTRNKHLSELDTKISLELVKSVKELALWFTKLHTQNIYHQDKNIHIPVLNKGDTRLRDFIFNTNSSTIYGLDFEESYIGNHMDDLAWICSSFLDTNPGIFQLNSPKHKIDLVILFLNKYYEFSKKFYFSMNYFAKKLIENLNIVIRRRSLNIGKLNVYSIIDRLSKNL